MTVAKDDFRCAVCVKRHEIAAKVVNEDLNIHAPASLECRALPPMQDVGRHAVFPNVQPDDYCHVYFEEDGKAVIAQRVAAKETAALDAKVADTVAAAQAQPALALGDEPAPRARRARAKAGE